MRTWSIFVDGEMQVRYKGFNKKIEDALILAILQVGSELDTWAIDNTDVAIEELKRFYVECTDHSKVEFQVFYRNFPVS